MRNYFSNYDHLLYFSLLWYTFSSLATAADDDYDYEAENEDGLLLCRRCGHEVASSAHLHRRVPSALSLKQRNETIVGVPRVLIQLFENPAGEEFEVIMADKADIYESGTATADFTWFPGYTWKVALCPSCGAHLGWFYQSHGEDSSKQSTNSTFVGLVLDSLLSADCK